MRNTEKKEHFLYRKTAKGMLYNFGGKNIGFAANFLFIILIARYLGPEDYGEYSFYRNMANFLILFTILGFDYSLNRFLPELRNTGEEEQLSGILNRSLKFSVVGIILISLFTLLTFHLIPDYFGYDFGFPPGILVLFLGLIITLTMSGILKGVMSGLFKQKLLNITESTSIFVKLILVLMFLEMGLEIEGVLLGVLIAFFFPPIIYYHKSRETFGKEAVKNAVFTTGNHDRKISGEKDNFKLSKNIYDRGNSKQIKEEGEKDNHKIFSKVDYNEFNELGKDNSQQLGKENFGRFNNRNNEHTKKRNNKLAAKYTSKPQGNENIMKSSERWVEIRKYSGIMFLFSLTYLILGNQMDVIMLKYISGDEEAGLYNLAFRFAFINSMVFIGAIDGVLVTTFSSMKKVERKLQQRTLTGIMKFTSLFLIPSAVAGIYFSENIIIVLFGNEFADSADMLKLLFPTLLLAMAVSWPIRYMLVSVGKELDVLKVYLGYGLLNLAGNALLIPKFGGTGAVISTGTAAWLISLHFILISHKNGALSFPFNYLIKIIFSSVVPGILLYIVKPNIETFPFLVLFYLAYWFAYLGLLLSLKVITKNDMRKLVELLSNSA